LLPLLDASMTQTRFILALAPRPGYWERFSLYLQLVKEELSTFLVSGNLHKFSQEVIRDVLDENAAQIFPVRAGCLKALYQMADTSKMTVWSENGYNDRVIIAEILSSMIVQPDKIDTLKGTFYYCYPDNRVGPPDGWGGSTLGQEDRKMTGSNGFHLRRFPDDPKAERMSMEQAWHCAARVLNQKSEAAERYFFCLTTQGETPRSCEQQLALTCPTEFAGAEFRCWLPACSHAKMVAPTMFPCTNFEGSIMTIDAKGDNANCQNACLKIKACGAVLYEKSANKCTLFPPKHDCKFDKRSRKVRWGENFFTEIIEG